MGFRALALLLPGVSACGGGPSPESPVDARPGGADAPPAVPDAGAGPTTIGPAGGTAAGPDGAKVTVPAGALSADVTIAVQRDSSGAPVIPASGVDTAGATFALLPHGTAFAQAATVTIPFDVDRIPTDADPTLYKAEPGGAFAAIPTTVNGGFLEAQVDGFSWVVPGYASAGPRVAYMLTSSASGLAVSSFKIARTVGTLSAATSSAPVGDGPISVTVHPSRRFLYVTNAGSKTVGTIAPNSLSVYALDGVTGAITRLVDTKVASAAKPTKAVVHSTGKFVYVVNHDRFSSAADTDLSIFAIDPTTGALSDPTSTADSQGAPPTDVAFAPSGDFAYVTYIFRTTTPVGNTFFERVKTYSVDRGTGALSGPIGDAAAGSDPWAVAVTRNGKAAYVASLGSDEVRRYSINQTTGTLTYRDSAIAQSKPASLAVDSEDRFLYVGKQQPFSNVNLLVFAIDSASGALTPADSRLTGAGAQVGPIAVVAEPQGQFVYAMDPEGELVTYSVGAEGVLTPQGNPVTGIVAGGATGGVGDPFTFAAGGASPIWESGCSYQVVAATGQVVGGCVYLASGPLASDGGGSTPPPPVASHALNVTLTGNGSGTITSTPPGIDYSNIDLARNQFIAAFATGSAVTLCVTPSSAVQMKWTGNGGCGGTTNCTNVVLAHDVSCELELDLVQ
jgi:6-phosphogluconolactonase (cycloisomerase 2 family)